MMSSTLRILPQAVLTSSWVALGLLACADAGGPAVSADTPAAAVAPTRAATLLHVDVSPGLGVLVDGQSRGTTPLPPLEVQPGSHTLTLVAACKQVEVPVEVRANETTTVGQGAAAGLGLVTLELTARNLAGEPLEHAVTLGDQVFGGGKGASTSRVPPCKARLKVTSAGLGGFIEDIDFGKEAPARREIVLAPGPDLVRLHGGRFTPGTGGALMNDEETMCFPKPYYEVQVKSFELDRTEVTAEQWKACRKAGGCQRSRPKWGVTTKPTEGQYLQCSVAVFELEDAFVKPGREQHPMNCIAQWEAEEYCRWAGKRLPTDVEWEYAARSGRSDYTFPWGNDYSPCINKEPSPMSACQFGDDAMKPPCAYPALTTAQGVCDMMGNVYEMVTYDDFPGRKKGERYPDGGHGVDPDGRQYMIGNIGGSISTCTISIDGMWGPWWQEPMTGFRCARDVEAQSSGVEER